MPRDFEEIPGALGAAEVARTASALGYDMLDCGAGAEDTPGALAYRIGYESVPEAPTGAARRLRVSEVFRRDGSGWVRIHRHVSAAQA